VPIFSIGNFPEWFPFTLIGTNKDRVIHPSEKAPTKQPWIARCKTWGRISVVTMWCNPCWKLRISLAQFSISRCPCPRQGAFCRKLLITKQQSTLQSTRRGSSMKTNGPLSWQRCHARGLWITESSGTLWHPICRAAMSHVDRQTDRRTCRVNGKTYRSIIRSSEYNSWNILSC
jgi:hypothetical protein